MAELSRRQKENLIRRCIYARERKIEKGYKVVCCVDEFDTPILNTESNHGLVSFIISQLNRFDSIAKGPVRYRKGKWTKHLLGCGPLTVFDDLESAEHFLFHRVDQYSSDRCQLWECKYVPTYSTKKQVRWRRYEKDYMESKTIDWLPPGTVLASKVKLTKKVDL